jgi:hypothetical protein
VGLTPDSTTKIFLAALDAGEFRRAAQMFERTSAERQRTGAIAMLRSYAKGPASSAFNPMTIARDAMSMDSASRAQFDTVRLLGLADTAVTIADLARIPISEFMAIGALARSRAATFPRYGLVGSVIEGDTLADVILHPSIPGQGLHVPLENAVARELLQLIKVDGRWLFVGRNALMSPNDISVSLMMKNMGLMRASSGAARASAAGATSNGCTAPDYPLFEFQVARPARYIPDPDISPSPSGKSGPPALVQFVVDTAGVPDVKTLRVLKADDDLAKAIKALLPRWRYEPARQGACKVPQLVQTPVMR